NVVQVHRIHQGHVARGIESCDQLVPLATEVVIRIEASGSPGGLTAEALLEFRSRAIGDHRDGAGGGQACRGTFALAVLPVLPAGMGFEGHAWTRVQRDRLRRGGWGGGEDHQPVYGNSAYPPPLERNHPPQGSAAHEGEPPDAEMLDERQMG